jgi:hypothetical protein
MHHRPMQRARALPLPLPQRVIAATLRRLLVVLSLPHPVSKPSQRQQPRTHPLLLWTVARAALTLTPALHPLWRLANSFCWATAM